MNIITITREYGAGGGEVARKLAEALGWELLDRELLHQAAEVEHVPDAELERLDEKAITMADRFRLHPPHQKYLHGLKLAAEQRGGTGQRGPRGPWCKALAGRAARHTPLAAGGPEAVAGPADVAVGRLVFGRVHGPMHGDGPHPRSFHPLLLRRQGDPTGRVRLGLQHASVFLSMTWRPWSRRSSAGPR